MHKRGLRVLWSNVSSFRWISSSKNLTTFFTKNVNSLLTGYRIRPKFHQEIGPKNSENLLTMRVTRVIINSSRFPGEEWRCCSRRLHIVPAARAVLLVDLAKLGLECAYFVCRGIGRVDAVACVQLSWALAGLALALPALMPGGQRRHRWLWPLILLKMAECAVCALVLLVIFALSVSGPPGATALRWLIRWKYPLVEDKDSTGFTLLTFLVLCLLGVSNLYVLHILCRLRTFLRLKVLHLYAQQRHHVIRNIVMVMNSPSTTTRSHSFLLYPGG